MNISKIKNLVIYSVAGIIILSYITFYNLNKYHLKNYPRYSIAITTNFHYSKSSKVTQYYFFVNKRKYHGSTSSKNVKVPNGRYYVLYSWKNPEYNNLIINVSSI
jgi:hypothetical protein